MVIDRTDYKDDVLNIEANTRRKYNIINNEDGTVSLEDVTVYLQRGDDFSAAILNTIFAMLGGITIKVVSQIEYDAIPTPRPSKTLYLIPKE